MVNEFGGETPPEHHPIDSSRFEPIGETRAFHHLQVATKTDLDMVLPPLVGVGVLGYVKDEELDRPGVGPWYSSTGTLWRPLLAGAGMGPFDYNYLVDVEYATEVAAGRYTEGQEFTAFHGHRFRAYSDWAGFIAQAKADMAANADNRSALVMAATYTENVTIEMDWALAGTLVIDGMGMQNTILNGDLTHSGSNTTNEFVILRGFTITGDLIATAAGPGDRLRATEIRVGGDLILNNSTSDWWLENCLIVGDVTGAQNVTNINFEGCSVHDITTTGNTVRWQYRGGEILGSATLAKVDDVLLDTYFRGTGVPGYHVRVTGSGNKQLTIRGHMAFLSGASAVKNYMEFDQGATKQIDTNIDVTCEKPSSTTNEVHYLENKDGSAMQGGYVKIDCGVDSSGNRLEDMAGGYASVKGIFNRFTFSLAPCDAELDLSGSTPGANCVISGTIVGPGADPPDTVDGILYDAGGTTIGWNAFICRFENSIVAVAASTLVLPDASATNFMEVDSAGTISSNTTAYTVSRIPLGRVVTDGAGDITSITEESAVLDEPSPGQSMFFNGTFVETLDADISESAGVVTLSLQQEGAGDLTMRWHTGLAILDCTPQQTIDLTLGSDASPQANYIYVLESDQTQLTKSTTQWPSAEHIKVGYYLVPSAAFVAAGGGARCYIQQQWNDHRMGTDNMGHMAHMAERERRTSARYFSGIDPNGTTSYLTIVGTTVDYKATAGVVYQLHDHASPAVDTSTGDEVLVVNWPGVEGFFHNITNLFDITEDSLGNTIGNNKWFNLIIWGVANKTGTYEPAMINLPSGFYNTQAGAEQDLGGFDTFDIPREFDLESSVGYEIVRLTIQKQAASWAFGSAVDLRRRGFVGALGGASSPVTEFPDSVLAVFNVADNTKRFNFDASTISPSTTRTLTVPDTSSTILVSDGSVPLDANWNPGAFTIGNFDYIARPAGLQISDADFGGILAGSSAFFFFDTVTDALVYNRAANVFELRIGGTATFFATATGIETDVIDELQFSGNGVTVDGVLLKDAGITATGVLDFGGATSLEIPNSAAPTVDATGEIALDTSVASWDPQVIFYDGTSSQTVVSLRTSELVATDNFVVVYDSASGRFRMEAQAGAGGGEANTASNIGVAGVGLFDAKVGVDLQFKNINAASSKMSVTDDVGNNEVDLDVVEANVLHDNLGAGTIVAHDTLATGAELDELTSGGATTLHSHTGAGAHAILSATHTDTLAAAVVDGDVMIGNVTPNWSRLPITVPAANVRNLLGVDNGELRPSWKAMLDGTDPATLGDSGDAAPGTALVAAHRDHIHEHMVTLADLPVGHLMEGTAASRPSAGTTGKYYWATDRKVLYHDTGAAWEVVTAAVPVSMLYVPGTIPHSQNDVGDAMQVIQDVAFLKNVFVRVKSAPVSGTTIIRIVKNGSEIATDFTISAGTNTASGTLSDAQALFAQNDFWTFNTKAGTASGLPDNINVQLRPG